MKRSLLLLLTSLFASGLLFSQNGFTSVTPLSSISLSEATKDKPQAKVWNYAGKWWCVLSALDGTQIFRLDGNTWSPVLTLNAKTSKPDYRIDGDLVHILFYKGEGNNSFLYTVKYNPSEDTYDLWDTRPGGTAIIFPAGSITATFVVDKKGRMWVASNERSQVYVWWSDAPYQAWSEPKTIATGISENDICAIAAIPARNKIAVIWSNHIKKRFGCRTHDDAGEPGNWSEDEMPAAASAIPNAGAGMADDHLNIKVGSDGTLYCAAKSDYNIPGLPKIILLVRRPSGSWDPAYTVTKEPEGTQPVLLLNETKKKLEIIYSTAENGGDIVYRESATGNISFGKPMSLFKSPGSVYDYAVSTHENFTNDIVILATDISKNPMQAVGVRATLEAVAVPDTIHYVEGGISASPNPFNSQTTIKFTVRDNGNYTLTVHDINGIKKMVIMKGVTTAGVANNVSFNGSSFPAGLYFVTLETAGLRRTIRVFKNN